jgi:hypothetical protein
MHVCSHVWVGLGMTVYLKAFIVLCCSDMHVYCELYCSSLRVSYMYTINTYVEIR